jgi:hypothetical protein
MTTNPPKRTRVRRKPDNKVVKRTTEVAENTLSKMKGDENAPEIKVETPEPNKYLPKRRVGAPSIGRGVNYVESVGLGKLKVKTANGNTDV